MKRILILIAPFILALNLVAGTTASANAHINAIARISIETGDQKKGKDRDQRENQGNQNSEDSGRRRDEHQKGNDEQSQQRNDNEKKPCRIIHRDKEKDKPY